MESHWVGEIKILFKTVVFEFLKCCLITDVPMLWISQHQRNLKHKRELTYLPVLDRCHRVGCLHRYSPASDVHLTYSDILTSNRYRLSMLNSSRASHILSILELILWLFG